MTQLRVENLACIRGFMPIYRGVSFAVQPGQLLWLRGANGAGKTSLLRQLAGLAPVADGQIWCDDRLVNPVDGDYKTDLAYFGHRDGLRSELTVLENIQYLSLAAWSGGVDQAVLKFFALESMTHIPVRYLSQGQRKRVALSSLFLTQNRRIWLLDEPFTNLDDDAAGILRRQIALRQNSGWITVITSHQDQIGLPCQQFILRRC